MSETATKDTKTAKEAAARRVIYDQVAMHAYGSLVSRMNMNGGAAAREAFNMADEFMIERERRSQGTEGGIQTKGGI